MVTTGLNQVLVAVQAAVQAAVNQLPSTSPILASNVIVRNGWVSQDEMTQILNNSTTPSQAIVTIFDTKTETDVTRYITTTPPDAYAEPVVGETVSPYKPTVISPGRTASFTISLNEGYSNPNPGDVFGVSATTGVFIATGVEYVVLSTDTVNSALNSLSAQINSSLSTYISSTVAGNVLTVTNVNGDNVIVTFGIGGIGSFTSEVGRTKKLFQVDYWCPNEEIREFLGDWVDASLDYYRINLGIKLADNSYARIAYRSTQLMDDNQERSLYRRMSQFLIEYPRNYAQNAYTVLIPSLDVS